MPSRRQIREATIQLLYARKSTLTETPVSEEIWGLINDRAEISYDRARLKVLIHLQQNRIIQTEKLEAALQNASSLILSADPSEKLAKQFQKLIESEQQWVEQLENLPALAKSDTGNWRQSLEDLFLSSRSLLQSRNTLTETIQTFPSSQRDQILSLLKKLKNFDERAEKVSFPNRYPEQRELEHLHTAHQEMSTLKEKSQSLSQKVTDALEQIDQRIESTTKNYDLKRLSKVDLSILRLAVYEITLDEAVPPSVAIDEAIELAKAFSGQEAASFVNGILDAIAKSLVQS